jgi:MFS transporter, ACS family, D-galactonate transporter
LPLLVRRERNSYNNPAMNRPLEVATPDESVPSSGPAVDEALHRTNPYSAPELPGSDQFGGSHPERPPGPTFARYFVLLWLCLAATIAYISRNSLGVAEKTIRTDLGLTEHEMGWAMSAFFWAYAVTQLPTGWLADRLGSRKALTIFSLGWSLATALCALAVFGQTTLFEIPEIGLAFSLSLFILFTTRFMNGVFQAGLFPGCTNTISKWFSKHDRAFPCGALASFMSLGGAAGGAIAGFLLGPLKVSWEWLFIGFSLPGILWAIGYYLWFRDTPAEHKGVNEAELWLIRDELPVDRDEPQSIGQAIDPVVKAEQLKTPWLAILSSPAMFWICAQQFFRAAAYMFFASWFPTYLQETRGVSLEKSAYLSALPLMAVVIGGLAGGTLSDVVLRRTGSRRLGRQAVAGISMTLCGAIILCAYFIDNPILAVIVISIGTLFFALGSPVSYAITMDMGDKHVATVFSTMNMSGNLGAALFPLVVTKFRAATSWESVLLLFGGMFLASAFCWLMLNPNGTIFDQSLIRRDLDEAPA